ncbi:uncharacterized protein KY384_000925 [Bacidia gigantensis]|uniref:uncharacterized protein n=1 Tax=Bacidia gigantensis TaxID=2732470 RepID=UPI001D03B7AA|nr:uncharacterized protein KY384_000925 [Bacidia gigantensis]KAG8534082.1 hypothetical protein KY384_000925 [Bacidia gigantensis]
MWFDDSPAAEAATVLQHPRVLAYCRLRCFCSGIERTAALRQQFARRTTEARLTLPVVLDQPFLMSFDASADGDIVGSEAGKFAYTIPAFSELDANEMRGYSTADQASVRTANVRYVTLEEENRILPIAPLHPLPPAPTWDCGVLSHQSTADDEKYSWSSAGTYCHRLPNGERTVWWSDDLTPNRGLTWDGSPFQALMARMVCARACYCSTDPERKKIDLTDSPRVGSVQIAETQENGRNVIEAFLSQPDGSVRTVLISSSAVSADDDAGAGAGEMQVACKDEEAGCREGWPEELLGPKPTWPAPLPEKDELTKLDQCGTFCYEAKDCGGDWKSGCRCVVPKELPVYALDAVFPKQPELPRGRCMTMPDYVLKAAMVGQSILGKRRKEV